MALDRLRLNGERVTKPRRAVLEVLVSQSRHVTADEVADSLAASVHRATVYRTLDLLVTTGVVTHRDQPGAATRYHVAAMGGEHGHLHGHCDSCGKIVPLPIDMFDDVAARILAGGQFTLDTHRSTFAGRCRTCSDRSRTADDPPVSRESGTPAGSVKFSV